MDDRQYIIGLDFGTDSVRAVVVNVETGKEEAGELAHYRRWSKAKYCDPAANRFRQHPLDYTEGLTAAIQGALQQLPAGTGRQVAGIGIDTTGSTPCAVDRDGIPLALKEGFQENPNAMFVLWKDHTAVKEAEEINRVAHGWEGPDYTGYEGGIYSSEWFWAKVLHVLREDRAVAEAAFSWVEHCDWMPALLTGNQDPLKLKRSRCAAGHKAMWHSEWNGLPPEEFLIAVDPLLKGLRDRLYSETCTADVRAGDLTEAWAQQLGLPAGIAVSVGAFDAHIGAVGGGIQKTTLSKIMGTSTCDMIVAPYQIIGDKQVDGICGQVDGSIVPGLVGLEAGQSSFGDVYAWFVDLLYWPLLSVQSQPAAAEEREQLQQGIKEKILANLTEAAEQLSLEETGPIALDWLNGRRTPDADQGLKGAVVGLTLGTTAPKIFKALVEATAFGSRAIVDRFTSEGVIINEVVALGGIAQKSPLVMQITADVLNIPIKVVASDQACALGAAMFGAVAAGVYSDVLKAQSKMSSGFSRTYTPNPKRAKQYQKLYEQYLDLGVSLAPILRAL